MAKSSKFEWDGAKAKSNQRKHGISFDEAASVFDDPNVAIIFDDEHSDDEERWIAFGMSDRARVLIVSRAYRDGAIRIISVRRATLGETESIYGQA